MKILIVLDGYVREWNDPACGEIKNVGTRARSGNKINYPGNSKTAEFAKRTISQAQAEKIEKIVSNVFGRICTTVYVDRPKSELRVSVPLNTPAPSNPLFAAVAPGCSSLYKADLEDILC